jgi:hypothetical protein
MCIIIGLAAVLMVFRDDLFGRWRTRSRAQMQHRIDELDTSEFIQKQQRRSSQSALGGCITLAVGLYILDVRMTGSAVRFLPPLDQAMFLLSILAFNSAIQSFWQSDQNWLKKEQDRLAKKLTLPERARSSYRFRRSSQLPLFVAQCLGPRDLSCARYTNEYAPE